MANPRCYRISNAGMAVASPTTTNLTLVSATTIRPEIYDILVGASATPADNAIQWDVQRFTAAGTVTAVTPTPLDPNDPSSLSSAGKTATGEPTYTANLILWHIALNQRATHRWNADPRGPLKFPATASNGGGLYATNGSFTGNVDTCVYFDE